jgi:anti-sigma regulatory factor (Ser/Thr protein kinase)
MASGIEFPSGFKSKFRAELFFEIVVPAQTGNIQAVVDEVKRRIQDLKYPDSIIDFDIPLALTEALANAIVHGSRKDPSKNVTVSVSATRRKFECVVTDEGPGFNHRLANDCVASTDDPPTSGRGLFLIRNLMSEVKFNRAGNQIRLVLKYPGPM